MFHFHFLNFVPILKLNSMEGNNTFENARKNFIKYQSEGSILRTLKIS